MGRLASLLATLIAAGLLGQALTASAGPRPPELTLPFSEGEPWLITCGYADATGCQHKDNDWNRYALDFQHTAGAQATAGRPALAAADGTVEIAGWGGGDSFGWYVQLDHDDGYRTIYAHLDERPGVEPGQAVSRGDMLGRAGCTGLCTGPHIHFVLMHNGKSIPPEPMCGQTGLDTGQIHTGCAPPSGPVPDRPNERSRRRQLRRRDEHDRRRDDLAVQRGAGSGA